MNGDKETRVRRGRRSRPAPPEGARGGAGRRREEPRARARYRRGTDLQTMASLTKINYFPMMTERARLHYCCRYPPAVRTGSAVCILIIDIRGINRNVLDVRL
ncbi:hypothetical protein EVAR_16321_1 [Eumeta japonica]|uniref:Uncharacterized protein n=1 Tax=Eumeta variegata TaxID=151549 RepID=A0A4C1VF07_EUMVA|nr:hypothetical protein EVAR_16321_1 [Eumeta japonica]